MIFDLVKDFADVLGAMPEKHPRRQILKLLDEALRRDVHFIDRHPTTFFQCMWNTCWWYDCPEAAEHYEPPAEGWNDSVPWKSNGLRLSTLLQTWRSSKDHATPGTRWVRSLRPPAVSLGSGQTSVFRGHMKAVNAVSFSPDGSRVASGSSDATIRIWDSESGAQLLVLSGHVGPAVGVHILADDRTLVSGGDQTVRIWDIDSGLEKAQFQAPDQGVTCVACSADGRLVACGSADGTIRIWNLRSRAELLVLKGQGGSQIDTGIKTITSLDLSPDGRRLVSNSYDRTTRVWDLRTGQQLFVVETDPANSVVFTADGRRVVVATSSMLGVMDADTGVTLVESLERCSYSCIGCRPDGTFVAVRGLTLQVWDLDLGRVRAIGSGHENNILAMSCTRDGARIATASQDATVRLRDVGLSFETRSLRAAKNGASCASFAPDGRSLATGAGKAVVLWNTASGVAARVMQGHQQSVECVAFSPDGTRIVSGSCDHTVRLWETNSGVEIGVLGRHEASVSSVAYSPDGRRILSTSFMWNSSTNSARLWDAESGAELAMLGSSPPLAGQQPPNTKIDVRNLSFSRDGRRIVGGCSDGSVRLWDAETGTEVTILPGRHAGFPSAVFAPDSRRVLSIDSTSFLRVSSDIRIHDVEGERSGLVVPHAGPEVSQLVFSRDGRQFVTVGGSSRVVSEVDMRLWDSDSGECLALVKSDGEALGSADTYTFPLATLSNNRETVFQSVAPVAEVAWVLETLRRFVARADRQVWCSYGMGANFGLFKLEGDDLLIEIPAATRASTSTVDRR